MSHAGKLSRPSRVRCDDLFMASPGNGDEKHTLWKFPRYPAPGRPEQRMWAPPSAVPWLVLGVILTALTVLGLFVALIAVLPEQ